MKDLKTRSKLKVAKTHKIRLVIFTETPDFNTGPIGDKIYPGSPLGDTIITYMIPLTINVEATDLLELEKTPDVWP